MKQPAEDDTTVMGERLHFQTTRWHLVQASGDNRALDALIRSYWKPLYFFVRRHGFDNETSKDLVQSFLTSFLQRRAFEKADPARGRFRTYLLRSMENFIKDFVRAGKKRAHRPGQPDLALDFAGGETEYQASAGHQHSPVTALNQAWARSLWEQGLRELRGASAHLEAFRLYRAHEDLASIARKTGLSVSAAQSAIQRMKRQLKGILVDHIRQTVSSEEDLQAELREFVRLLS